MRTATNALRIDAKGAGWILQGYLAGKRIRKHSTDLAALAQLKEEMERPIKTAAAAELAHEIARPTWLSTEQLHEAEAAFRIMLGHEAHKLTDAVRAGLPHLDNAKAVEVQAVVRDWLADMEAEHAYPVSVVNCRTRIARFLAEAGVKMLGEITSEQIERWVKAPGLKPYTQLGRAAVIRAFLNFAVRRELLRASPFKIDTRKLNMRARQAVETPRIISATQAQALLQAAASLSGGRMLPYTILSLWCFLRSAEAKRVTGADIHLDGRNFVTIRPHKSGTVSHREVEIPDNVAPLLAACFKRGLIEKATPLYFARFLWVRIRAKAGLVDLSGQKNKSNMPLISGGVWTENILRHSGISYFQKRGGDVTVTARQAGNSPAVIFRHYLRLADEKETERFYSLRVRLPATPRQLTPAISEAAA